MNETLEGDLRLLHSEIQTGLGDPHRLLILFRLATGPKTIDQLARSLDLDQASVARHVQILRQSGLVLASAFRGETRYEVSDDRVPEALVLLRGALRDRLVRREAMADTLSVH
ncbi:MAG: winged helix-turn-helix domain-containing protein [Anaerolineales bacterium]